MAFKTREGYYADLRAMRKNVYKNGHAIEDLVTDPATMRLVENEAYLYDALQDPEFDPILKETSSLTGNEIVRWISLNTEPDKLKKSVEMKRFAFDHVGTCMAGICVGHNIMNVLWSVTYDIDKAKGTEYHKRLEKWIIETESKCYKVAGALTDAKGDRSKSAGQQDNPDASVHIKEIRPDGIVVSGAKVMIAHAAVCQEIFVGTGTGYKEADKDYAVSFVVPRDIEGLTIIQTDASEGREGWDDMKYGDQSSYLIFEDCFIPNERVFMCGEYEFSGSVIDRFVGNYRACIGSCVAGQGDVMTGAAVLMARANGLPMKKFKDKLINMTRISETVWGLGLGSIYAGYMHESGVWFADPTIACVNKIYAAENYAELRRLLQDIGGGIAETGCFPNYKDCMDPVLGPKIMKAISANPEVTPENRARAARLGEWYARAGGLLAFVHGGGSPDGCKLVINRNTPYEKYAQYAADIAGIDQTIKDPQ
ncbi:MAG: 4-hydroxyphenylacetate 3-hydroxylase [Eubacterium sp.]|nr:4-hydroxyphenylacetate 3-hydroxylase [Eubacterium sp.]